jgi:hypothetical protein
VEDLSILLIAVKMLIARNEAGRIGKSAISMDLEV